MARFHAADAQAARDQAWMNLGMYWEHNWTADGRVTSRARCGPIGAARSPGRSRHMSIACMPTLPMLSAGHDQRQRAGRSASMRSTRSAGPAPMPPTCCTKAAVRCMSSIWPRARDALAVRATCRRRAIPRGAATCGFWRAIFLPRATRFSKCARARGGSSVPAAEVQRQRHRERDLPLEGRGPRRHFEHRGQGPPGTATSPAERRTGAGGSTISGKTRASSKWKTRGQSR